MGQPVLRDQQHQPPKCLQRSTPTRSTLEPLEAKSVHRPPLLPRSVRWVCRQRRLEKISQKQLETGYAYFRKDLLESWSDKLGNIERTPCHRQAHHPKPSSRGFRRPLCLVSRHQGLEGTPPRPKEGNSGH